MALRHLARSTVITSGRLVPEISTNAEHELLAHRVLVYRIDGSLFLGAVQRFLWSFAEEGDVRVVLLRLADLWVLDASGAAALGEIVETLEHRGITVSVKCLEPEHLRILDAVGAIDRLKDDGHVFDDLSSAVAHAVVHAERPRALEVGLTVATAPVPVVVELPWCD